jgi:thioredoxin-like negative regulator of GroEL
MTITNVTEATFKQEVLDSETPVLVDFWPLGVDLVECCLLLLKK